MTIGVDDVRARAIALAFASLAAAAILAGAARAAPPQNDAFAAAEPLAGESGSTGGTTAEATRETGEPTHDDDAGGRTVWYRWTAPATAAVIFETCGPSAFDTILAAYVGESPVALSRVASNDDACGEQSRIVFGAVAETTYFIAVDGYDDAAGAFTLSWRVVIPPANDSFASAQPLEHASGTATGTSLGAGREDGEPTDEGAATIWYSWTAPLTGVAAFETCGSAFDTVLSAFSGTSLDALTRLASNDDSCGSGSRIRFRILAGAAYVLHVYGVDGSAGDVRLSWVARPIPANDDFHSARRLRGTRGSLAASNVAAGAEVGEPRRATTLWYRWRAPRTMAILFETCSRATFDTVIAVYRGTSLRRAQLVAEDDDACAEDRSRVVFVATAGIDYRIGVGGFAGATGDFTLTWRSPRPFEQPCNVPDVRGQTLARARAALGRALCRVGRIAFVRSSIVPSGRIVAQFPTPGTRLPILGRVNLEVSRG